MNVDYEIVKVSKSEIPDGAKLVECYETTREIIVVGEPRKFQKHDCDAMGCSSMSHVIYRFNKL